MLVSVHLAQNLLCLSKDSAPCLTMVGGWGWESDVPWLVPGFCPQQEGVSGSCLPCLLCNPE